MVSSDGETYKFGEILEICIWNFTLTLQIFELHGISQFLVGIILFTSPWIFPWRRPYVSCKAR